MILMAIRRSLCLHRKSFAAFRTFTSVEPNTMKLTNNKDFQTIVTTPTLVFLSDLFTKNGYELRIAGGAVRDLLMHKPIHDVDFATTATPTQMKEMFSEAQVRLINNNGESHGTISCRIEDKDNYEITTLRIDKTTDGRHAEVEFTTDWYLDANRRDLTINSMFLGLDGTVYDYFNGIEDLKKRRVAFVGSAEARIMEDYLRILRYFRFYGRISEESDSHDPDTIAAIEKTMSGLKHISGVRIWTELSKILMGNHAKDILLRMVSIGMHKYMGLPESPDIENFKLVFDRSLPFNPHYMTRMVALYTSSSEILDARERLSLSNFERDLALSILANKEGELEDPVKELKYQIVNTKLSTKDMKIWSLEFLKYQGLGKEFEELDSWEIPRFPLSGQVLIERGVKGGKTMGAVIELLRDMWAESNYTMSSDDLIAHIDEVSAKVELNKGGNQLENKRPIEQRMGVKVKRKFKRQN